MSILAAPIEESADEESVDILAAMSGLIERGYVLESVDSDGEIRYAITAEGEAYLQANPDLSEITNFND